MVRREERIRDVPNTPRVTTEEAEDLKAEVAENEDPEDRELIDLDGRDEPDDVELSERDYLDDEHPEDEEGDITPYRTEGEPLDIVTADDPLKEAASDAGKPAGGGRHR